jgi:hypothetical protein
MLNLSLYILPFENMIKGSSYMQEENLPYTSVFPVYQVSILLVICFNIYHNDLPLFLASFWPFRQGTSMSSSSIFKTLL